MTRPEVVDRTFDAPHRSPEIPATRAREHLRIADYPETLAILDALLGEPIGRAGSGYEPTEQGAWIEWDLLLAADLALGDRATLHRARGCAIDERCGGFPPAVRVDVLNVVETLADRGIEPSSVIAPAVLSGVPGAPQFI